MILILFVFIVCPGRREDGSGVWLGEHFLLESLLACAKGPKGDLKKPAKTPSGKRKALLY